MKKFSAKVDSNFLDMCAHCTEWESPFHSPAHFCYFLPISGTSLSYRVEEMDGTLFPRFRKRCFHVQAIDEHGVPFANPFNGYYHARGLHTFLFHRLGAKIPILLDMFYQSDNRQVKRVALRYL